MLRLNPAPTFSGLVKLTVAGDDAPAVLTVEWRHKTAIGLQDWLTASRDTPLHQALTDVIVRWEGVSDERGAVVEYTPEALQVLCGNYHAAAKELLAAYLKQLTESRTKN